ncbi:uncharacterized protein [Rutidosis leptorrhynchoides]|uniref:uncharacterized protein n=1 Tax=Rutidosis leptorrhynchoides TaxID=125765 RepID=UPI003A995753
MVNSYVTAQNSGLITKNPIRVKIGNGRTTRFWHDTWLGEQPLRCHFNRLFHLDVDLNFCVADIRHNEYWNWNWQRHNIGGRNERALVDLIDMLGNVNCSHEVDTRTWVISNSGSYSVLPTHFNLINRGVHIEDLGCPLCNHGVEHINHTFFKFVVANEIWRKVGLWTNVGLNGYDSWNNLMDWYEHWDANGACKIKLYSTITSVLWLIWRFGMELSFRLIVKVFGIL